MHIKIEIPPKLAGLRLDQAVVVFQSQISRSRVASLISQGLILVNHGCKRPGYKVKPKDLVEGDVPLPDQQDKKTLLPEPIPLNILYEDDYILMLDKPAGLVVHPGAGNASGTLVNALIAHHSVFGEQGWDKERPGIVHRLDKDTSGLMVIAKNLKSLEFLQKEFKQRRVEKHYLALARGENIPDAGVIERPIGRHPRHRKRMAILDENGRYAKTRFRVINRFSSGCLMDIRLYTGRTHQIRVHFYDQGMPLFGDCIYQERRFRKKDPMATRLMLHSRTLSFRHPYSGVRLSFEASMPEDFKTTLLHLSDAS
ncbi:RluA family pseudouridine synthase [Desulfobacter hydrogenophilus]|uniref:Pseudouridine synthase n=1 Tax=Desulfobacter hydrogenophilus TaxID=2291 RepID=A0A328FHK5_9BACT|nr:RluA family pseudouridine synthase [Desulfobacter hydrogenophilus]NDY74064.1 RluA family pseudouridine synthase [Desulfobacter hydrogenophilus]QBH13425.1 RluA family pseudouridine synthase [Desulfobacter hydrogenophilus]RAM03676.1 RluA family pseudouridine synthase [Desulfobacter hydrogenophilus]